jgi:hypothetical protein
VADLVHVKGLAQLQTFLSTLPVKMEKNIMRGALRAGAKPILADAKMRVRKRSGATAASMRISTMARGGRVIARVIAGKATYGNVPIWLEYGTRPHLISVGDENKPINARLSARRGSLVRVSIATMNRAARALGSLVIGGRFVGPVIHHPGSRAFPFMRPAADARATDAVVATGRYIRTRLTKSGLSAAAAVNVEAGT